MFRKLAPGILALTCATVVQASGTTHMVSADGSMEYTSIQDAIDAAVNGDVIKVFPGTYSEKLDTKGKAIEVTGQPDPKTGDLPVITSTGEYGPIMTFNTGEEWTTKVSWFAFEEGDAEWGGAVCCYGAKSMFARCIFSENDCGSFGGAVYMYRSPVRFLGCFFTDNWVHGFGGGLYVNHVGGAAMRPTLLSCFFVGNDAHNTSPDIHGGWNHQGFCAFAADAFDGDDDVVPDGLETQMFNFENDGEIDADDLLSALTVFGIMGIFNPGDRDGDGDIDGDDFELMLKDFWNNSD